MTNPSQAGQTTANQTAASAGSSSFPSQQSGAMNAASSGGTPGHSVSQSDSLELLNPIPGLNYPVTKLEIQNGITNLPADQQAQWAPILSAIPEDTTYNSFEEIQATYQRVEEAQAA